MATYYVDGTRPDDSGAGTSEATAKKTIAAGVALLSQGDTLWIKASTVYSLTSAVALPSAVSYTSVTRIRGYGTTIGDGVRPTIRCGASSVTLFTQSNTGISLETLDLDGNLQASSAGVNFTQVFNQVYDCVFRRFTETAVTMTSTNPLVRCEVKDCTGATAISTAGAILDCYIHDNSGYTHLRSANVPGVIRSVFANNGDIGLLLTHGTPVDGCVFYGNASHGCRLEQNYLVMWYVTNSIFYGNGGYGLAGQSAPSPTIPSPLVNRNAFGANTSGPRNNVSAGADDITLTADPFVNAAAGDFNLNNVAGGGALLRAVTYDLPG